MLLCCHVSTFQRSNGSTPVGANDSMLQRFNGQSGGRAMRRLWVIGALLVLVGAPPSVAQQSVIKVGVVVDVTGGASSLGVPERNTVLLYQDELGEVPGPNGPVRVQYVATDGESDPTKAVIAAKRLIDEDRVVAVVCCTTSPASLAVIQTLETSRVPNVSLAGAVTIIEPVDQRRWIFKTPQTDRLMIDVITDHMRRRGIRSVAWLGFDDAFGQGGLVEFEKLAATKGSDMAAKESLASASAGGHALDAMLILKPAIERTLRQGIRPENTGGFRTVLRDQIERGTKELVGITGIFNYTPTDHLGLDLRAAVMIEVRNGTWTPAR